MPGRQYSFEAIGTSWKIDIYQAIATEAFERLVKAIRQRIDTFDQHYSRFRPDSLVTKMSRRSGTYKLPADAQPLFDVYQELYGLTNGAMTPLIGDLLVEAGYDSEYSLVPGTLHHPPTWSKALDYRFPQLTLRRPVMIDLGAAGKGYLVDIVVLVTCYYV